MAVVVDAEVTGLLMMGALSPGLKRHSVSLFEGAPLQGPVLLLDDVAHSRVSTLPPPALQQGILCVQADE